MKVTTAYNALSQRNSFFFFPLLSENKTYSENTRRPLLDVSHRVVDHSALSQNARIDTDKHQRAAVRVEHNLHRKKSDKIHSNILISTQHIHTRTHIHARTPWMLTRTAEPYHSAQVPESSDLACATFPTSLPRDRADLEGSRQWRPSAVGRPAYCVCVCEKGIRKISEENMEKSIAKTKDLEGLKKKNTRCWRL